MATPIGQLVVEIAANSAVFRSELERARGDFAKFTGAIRSGLQGLGLGVSVAAFSALVKSAVSAGSAINDMGVRLGIGTDHLQALQHAARQSGADVDDLEMGLRKLNVTMAAAADDNAEARETLARLGMSWRTSSGATREAGDAIEEFAQRFTGLSESMKADVFQKIFGRAKGMRNVLDELGKQGFGAVEEGARRAGVVLDGDMVKALDRVGDEFESATQSIKVGFMRAVADSEPLLLKLAKALGGVGRALSSAVEEAESWWTKLDKAIERLMNRFGGPGFQPLPTNPNIGVGNLDVGTTLPPGPPGPPPPNRALLLKEAQARAAAVENQLNIAKASALAGAEGPNKAVDQIKIEIEFSQKLRDAKLQAIEVERRLTLTDTGRAELAAKAAKVVSDSTVEQINQYAKLGEALEEAFKAQAELAGSFEGEAAVAQRDIDILGERAEAVQRSVLATKDLIAVNDALASQGGRDTADEVAGFGMLAAAPKPGQEDFLKRGQVLADFNKQMRAIEISSQTMGFGFDSNTAKIAAMENALRKAAENGIDPTDEAVQRLSADLEALKFQQSIITDIFGALKNAVDTSVQGIILGTTTLKEAFRNMGQSIAVSLVQSAVDRGLKLLQKALEDFIDWLVKSGLVKQAAQFLGGLAVSAFSSPSVGSETGGGTSAASFQHGGISHGGPAMLHGVEAVVPLQGGAIPVKMTGVIREQPVPMVGFARGGDQITIINNTPAEVSTKSEQKPDGRKIRTFIISEVNRGIEGGEFDKAVGVWGLKRQPVAR